MKSPHTSNQKIYDGDSPAQKVNCTPKTHKTVKSFDDFSLYHLQKESSPNFRGGQEVLEIGWGDSPEPLKVEQKLELNKTPITCKKKLETKESPKSSLPFKRRNVRSTFSLPSKSVVDVAKYVAEVQELSKKIMKEFNTQKVDVNLNENVSGNQFVEDNSNSPNLSNVQQNSSSSSLHDSKDNNCDGRNSDGTFDSVLQSFINEEDDWLSQALTSQDVTKTPHKTNFVKSKSENELSLLQPLDFEKKSLTQNCRNINNNFRRTSSFNMTNPQSNTEVNTLESNISDSEKTVSNKLNGYVNQYSLQEIERKRLEAKYRRERREIERKKLEALKKLEMKKLKAIKT